MSSRSSTIGARCSSLRRRERRRRRWPVRSKAANPGVCGSQVHLDLPQRVVFISVQHLSLQHASSRITRRAHRSPPRVCQGRRRGLPLSLSRRRLRPRALTRGRRRAPAPTWPRPRACEPWLGRGSGPAGGVRRGDGRPGARPGSGERSGSPGPPARQPCAPAPRRREPRGRRRGEDVVGHGVGQHGSGVHGIQGAASSAPRPPGLRPYLIPAGRKCDRGCAAVARGAAGSPANRTRHSAARNPRWMLAVATRAAASPSVGEVPCRGPPRSPLFRTPNHAVRPGGGVAVTVHRARSANPAVTGALCGRQRGSGSSATGRGAWARACASS